MARASHGPLSRSRRLACSASSLRSPAGLAFSPMGWSVMSLSWSQFWRRHPDHWAEGVTEAIVTDRADQQPL
jgi:hypothetical protein